MGRGLQAVFILLAFLASGSALGSRAQRKLDSTPEAVYWKTLTPAIQAVLDEALEALPPNACAKKRRWIYIAEAADVTGDGVPEALVQYCHMGAYTSDVTLMRLEGDKPVMARFRGKDAKVVQPYFLQGASARNGEDVKLLPEKHAVYAIHWHADDSGRLETCKVEAYVWGPESRTFDEDGKVGEQTAKSACEQVKQLLDDLARH